MLLSVPMVKRWPGYIAPPLSMPALPGALPLSDAWKLPLLPCGDARIPDQSRSSFACPPWRGLAIRPFLCVLLKTGTSEHSGKSVRLGSCSLC